MLILSTFAALSTSWIKAEKLNRTSRERLQLVALALDSLDSNHARQKRMGESFMTTVFHMMLNNWVYNGYGGSRMGPSADPFCLLAVATLPW